MSAGGPVGEASVTLKMGQDGVVDVKETFGLGDPTATEVNVFAIEKTSRRISATR